MGDLKQMHGLHEYKAKYHAVYPQSGAAKAAIQTGQLFRFVNEIQNSDLVLTPIRATRQVLIGEIAGDYQYDPQALSADYPNVRPVKWLTEFHAINCHPSSAIP